jgi:hypothetical protein
MGGMGMSGQMGQQGGFNGQYLGGNGMPQQNGNGMPQQNGNGMHPMGMSRPQQSTGTTTSRSKTALLQSLTIFAPPQGWVGPWRMPIHSVRRSLPRLTTTVPSTR